MSLLRRGIEGVCADLGGPLRARKVRAQSQCEVSRPWEEGEAKPPPARLRSNPYIRSSPSRRHRSRKAVRPARFGPWPPLGRQVGLARSDSQARSGQWKSNGRCQPQCHVLEDCVLGDFALEDGAHQARAHDRHGPWLRPTRIERRSKGSPPQLSAKVYRSKSCATATI